jgi:hypothetical protein
MKRALTLNVVRNREPAERMNPVIDPAGWSKEDLAQSDDWIYPLADREIADLDAAIASVETNGTALLDLNRERFRLPVLGPVLDSLREEIVDGSGFVLIRGVPIHRYTRMQSAIAFLGIGSYIGEAVSQNGKGHVLGHVKDLGGTSLENPTNRGYQTPDMLPFHCDATDVVGLLCLHPSKSGGASTIVSSITVYNEMLKRHPKLVAELCEPIYRDRRGEVPEGAQPYFKLPVFNFHDGYLSTNGGGPYLKSAQRFTELPPHSPALAEAIEVYGNLARDLCFAMEFKQGDIQFLHNHVTLHSRTAYEDYPEESRKRHLLRLWLATPNGRPLSPAFSARYPHLEPGQRPSGGIMVAGTTFQTPLEAE